MDDVSGRRPRSGKRPGRGDGARASVAVIGVIHEPRGERVAGLIYYLYGPGRHEEHTDPHIVAGWRHPAELEPPLRPDGTRDFRKLTGLLNQPHAAMGKYGFRRPVWHLSMRAAPRDKVLSDDEWAQIDLTCIMRILLLPPALLITSSVYAQPQSAVVYNANPNAPVTASGNANCSDKHLDSEFTLKNTSDRNIVQLEAIAVVKCTRGPGRLFGITTAAFFFRRTAWQVARASPKLCRRRVSSRPGLTPARLQLLRGWMSKFASCSLKMAPPGEIRV